MKSFNTAGGRVTQQMGFKSGGNNNIRQYALLLLDSVSPTSNHNNNSGYVVATAPLSQNPNEKAIYRINNEAFEKGIERIRNNSTNREAAANPPKFNPIIIDEKFEKHLLTNKVGNKKGKPYLIAERVSYLGKDKETKMNIWGVDYFSNVSSLEDRTFQGIFTADGYFDSESKKWKVTQINKVLDLSEYLGKETWGNANVATGCRAGNDVDTFATMIDETANEEAGLEYKTRYGFILRFVGQLATPIATAGGGSDDFTTTHIVLNSSPMVSSIIEEVDGKKNYLPITGDFFRENFEAYKEYIKENAAFFKSETERLGIELETNSKGGGKVSIEFIPFICYRAGSLNRRFSITPPQSGKKTPLMAMISTYTGLALNENFDEMDKTVGSNVAVKGVLSLTDDDFKNGEIITRKLVNGLYFNGFPRPVHDYIPAHGAVFGELCKLADALRISQEQQAAAQNSGNVHDNSAEQQAAYHEAQSHDDAHDTHHASGDDEWDNAAMPTPPQKGNFAGQTQQQSPQQYDDDIPF